MGCCVVNNKIYSNSIQVKDIQKINTLKVEVDKSVGHIYTREGKDENGYKFYQITVIEQEVSRNIHSFNENRKPKLSSVDRIPTLYPIETKKSQKKTKLKHGKTVYEIKQRGKSEMIKKDTLNRETAHFKTNYTRKKSLRDIVASKRMSDINSILPEAIYEQNNYFEKSEKEIIHQSRNSEGDTVIRNFNKSFDSLENRSVVGPSQKKHLSNVCLDQRYLSQISPERTPNISQFEDDKTTLKSDNNEPTTPVYSHIKHLSNDFDASFVKKQLKKFSQKLLTLMKVDNEKTNTLTSSLNSTFLLQSNILQIKNISDKNITNDDDGNQIINSYVVGADLGKGSYGTVKVCVDVKEYPEKYALKIIDKRNLKRQFFKPGMHDFNPGANEIKVLSKLHSPYIVKTKEILVSKYYTYIIMELMKNGSLHSYLLRNKGHGDLDIYDAFVKLILGIEYLHETAKVVHFDIKVDNLLLDDKLSLKISDFGISLIFEEDDIVPPRKIGSPYYMAPEMIMGGPFHGKPTDIWACGIVLYYLVYNKLPFFVDSKKDLQTLYDMIKNKQPDFPDHPMMCYALKDLIEQMLNKDPYKRITVKEIKAHSWFTQNGTTSFKLTSFDEEEDSCEIPEKKVLFDATINYNFLSCHANKRKKKSQGLVYQDI